MPSSAEGSRGRIARVCSNVVPNPLRRRRSKRLRPQTLSGVGLAWAPRPMTRAAAPISSARRLASTTLAPLCALAGALSLCSAPALAQRMHAFSASFGGEGAGNGQLSRPGALAVNEETGDVYVIDRGNGRVEIFTAAGTYVGQFNGGASPTGAFSFVPAIGGLLQPEGAIAVDNSTSPLDPSKGDVYVLDNRHKVIDKFSSSGSYIGQVVGASPASPYSNASEPPFGVAVDPGGVLWVVAGWDQIDQFNDALANEYVSSLKPKFPNTNGAKSNVLSFKGLALDSEDNLYTGSWPSIFEKFTVPTEFNKRGEALVEELDGEETTGFAVDLSSNDVYVDHETGVAVYGSSHSLIERFGSSQMSLSEGIAVDSATGTVYASNASSQEIDVFTAFVVPDVTTGSASSFAETSVTVGGVVNPDGLPVTSCVFEYGTSASYGQSAPCSASPGSGSSPVALSAELNGLQRLTKYHFRLNVSNANGSNQGQDRTFVTPEPVVFSEEAVSDVSSSSALFSVQVNPGGADTTYHFEYGPSVSYGESVPAPAGDLGAGTSSEPVSARAQDLLGETTYHVRVVASNVLGTVYGPDAAFTTQAGGGAFVLPDGRGWEMVSPPDKNGALIRPIGSNGGGIGGYGLIEASVDGSVVSYYASGPLGADPLGNSAPRGATQVLSKLGAGGWSSEDINTPHKQLEGGETEYTFFSADLSLALVEPYSDTPLSPEATEATPYVRDNGSKGYVPLVTANNVQPGTKFGLFKSSEGVQAVAATPDLSHVLVRSPFALTANAINAGGVGNIYEWSGGRLQLVNVLPDGTASTGASLGELTGYDTRHALSSDGSRVFFAVGRHIYMRDMVAGQTVMLDAPAPGVSPRPGGIRGGQFDIASADGSKVFFLDEEPLTLDSKLEPAPENTARTPSDLYVYDTVTGSLTDLSVDQNAGAKADVQQHVMGASEDGSIVYFVATGVLASGAESGKMNLYVESESGSSWSRPRFVAVLSAADIFDWVGSNFTEMSHLTSRVSPSGRYVTFMSDQSLTGYDNRDAVSGQPDTEVFLYDEATSRLSCVSCNPTGARPAGVFDPSQFAEQGALLVDPLRLWGENGRWLAASIPGWTEPKNGSLFGMAYQSRVLSDEGRMFFNSADALVPQDTNGLEDVYEYEPVGVGGSSGCTTATRTYVAGEGGCVSLISSGTSGEESAFLDASATGNDVFFLTAARLVPGDVDMSFDVYDARVCSTASPCVSAPVSLPPCTSGDSCKAAPSSQPAIFGAPPSATFSGAGNVTPAPAPKVARCKSGFVKKKRKCVKRRKAKRMAGAKRAGNKRRTKS
jgi:hypothetical protein